MSDLEYVRLCDHRGRLLQVLDFPRPYPPEIYLPREIPAVFRSEMEMETIGIPPVRKFVKFYEDGRATNEYWEEIPAGPEAKEKAG